ncbi:polysaccharide deacetylase family protein [Paenibacillus sp. GP183]|uniref:polysaccharide deacetylase family protein n=1 Tax=Paenibacillus sp. GP183 TaxID=1882751 RepID=UPI000895B6B9|nr:polysaccharide deacetylase family protein [Paenibacillus sp. GP183]SEB53292.1 Polysaccharide deacetylase [Paenibacillus sp. GP183]
MKSKLSAAFTIIIILSICLLTLGCKPQIREVVDTEAEVSIYPLPINFEPHVNIPEPKVEEVAAIPAFTPSPTPTASLIVSPTASPTALPASSHSVPAPIASVLPDQSGEVSIPVLNYHSIGVTQGNTLVLDPKKLTQQMEYLAEQGYSPLTLSDFILMLEKKKPAPAKPVLLTFDDGYIDNYEQAMPILKRHGFPATIFISPGTIGQEGKVNWMQLKEMHEAGWDIQPHGMTHPHLPELTAAEQKGEITQSRRQIEQQLGTKADIFCYPYGEFNKQTLAILKEEGFRYAFTIRQGRTTSSQDPFHLKRIYVNSEDSLLQWSKKL